MAFIRYQNKFEIENSTTKIIVQKGKMWHDLLTSHFYTNTEYICWQYREQWDKFN